MLRRRARPGWGLALLLLLLAGPGWAAGPAERSRPYAVLRRQNLAAQFICLADLESQVALIWKCSSFHPPWDGSNGFRGHWNWKLIPSGQGLFIHTMLMGSIFSILLITMILMAVCVYKPIRRR